MQYAIKQILVSEADNKHELLSSNLICINQKHNGNRMLKLIGYKSQIFLGRLFPVPLHTFRQGLIA